MRILSYLMLLLLLTACTGCDGDGKHRELQTAPRPRVVADRAVGGRDQRKRPNRRHGERAQSRCRKERFSRGVTAAFDDGNRSGVATGKEFAMNHPTAGVSDCVGQGHARRVAERASVQSAASERWRVRLHNRYFQSPTLPPTIIHPLQVVAIAAVLAVSTTSPHAADKPACTGLPNAFYAMDNGVRDEKHTTPESQVAMLKELGYPGIGWRPGPLPDLDMAKPCAGRMDKAREAFTLASVALRNTWRPVSSRNPTPKLRRKSAGRWMDSSGFP